MGYTEAQAKAFIAYIAPMMIQEGKARGYSVISTAIAQAIIEGACNTSQLAKVYHNHFGLKAGDAWLKAGKPAVSMKTKEEYTPGKLTSINDYFRVYSDDMACCKGYYDFISTKRYSNLKTAKNYIEYANMLKADGYATSNSYISTLCSTVVKYGLMIYDNLDHDINMEEYIIGKTYTTTSDVYIRDDADGNKVKYDHITPNAKANSFFDEYGYAILKKGSRVTVKAVKKLPKSTWVQIPSGWIIAYNMTNKYVI